MSERNKKSDFPWNIINIKSPGAEKFPILSRLRRAYFAGYELRPRPTVAIVGKELRARKGYEILKSNDSFELSHSQEVLPGAK